MEQLDESRVSDFREAFNLFDKNGDGKISVDELATVLKQLGQEATEAEVQDMLNEVDTDQNGTIDFSEFLNVMAKNVKEADHTQELRAAFKVFDRDDDGHISASELKQVMAELGENLTDEEFQEVLAAAGTTSSADGTQLIDYTAFVKLVTKTGTP